MRTFGLDLGTMSTVLAILEGGEPTVIPNVTGAEKTPTAIGFDSSGETLIGERALTLAEVHPERAFVGFPKYLGTDWVARVDGRRLTAVDLTARFVERLVADAEAWAREEFGLVAVTAPSWFRMPQRFALKRALEEADLRVGRLYGTTEAAAEAYGFNNPGREEELLVFALEGDGVDVGVFEVADGVIETKSMLGVRGVGGEALDAALARVLATRFRAETGVDVPDGTPGAARLLAAAARARADLTNEVAAVHIPYLTIGPSGTVHLEDQVSRQDLETAASALLPRYRDTVAEALRLAGQRADRLDGILLLGDATRLPAVAADLAALAPQARLRAWGPTTAALGAAVEAAVLWGEVKDVLTLRALPYAVGIATKGGALTPIIPRGTVIPTKRSQVFTTAQDNQPSVLIRVYEGDEGPISEAVALGEVELTGLPPAPRGVPQIEVELDADANAVLHLSARDLATGRKVDLVPRPAAAPLPAPSNPVVTGTGGVPQAPTTLDEPDDPDEPQFFLLLN